MLLLCCVILYILYSVYIKSARRHIMYQWIWINTQYEIFQLQLFILNEVVLLCVCGFVTFALGIVLLKQHYK